MKRTGIFLTAMLGCLQIACVAEAAAADDPSVNPYLVIAKHNSFGLVILPAPTVQDAGTPPPEITLNGIMAISDDKRALFKVRDQSSGKEKSYILSEGQRDGDIELLSVEMKNSTITVNNHGVVQTIAICKTPVFPPVENTVAAAGGVNPSANGNPGISNGFDQTPAPEFQSANGQSTSFQSGYQAGWSANSKTPSSTDNGSTANNDQNSGGSNSGGPNSSAPKTDPWWVRGSEAVERARVETAYEVLNGTAAPAPLTPLTPPGTPANLIGSEQLFFNHM
jgi:hypothetical protein